MHPLRDEKCPKCKSELPGAKSYKGKHICPRAQGSVASPPPGSEDESGDGGTDLTPKQLEELEAGRLLHALDQEMVAIMASKESKLARVQELKGQIGEACEEMKKIFELLRNKDAVDSEFGEILSSMINLLLNQSQGARRRR